MNPSIKNSKIDIEKISRDDAKLQGLKRFFTGIPCVKGHVAARQVGSARCVTCDKIHATKWRGKNKEAFLRSQKNWRSANLSILTKYRVDRFRDWRHENPGLAAAVYAKKRADRANAIPPWANMNAIAAIYEKASAAGLHVDHIIPLRGKTVCGLHVEGNLQLMDRIENIKKGNKFIDALTETQAFLPFS